MNNFPKKFFVNGFACGIKKNKKDLALFYSKKPCITAGMFTANQVKAAPVLVSQKHLKIAGNNIQAIIVNSGCANACTGKQGLNDAEEMCQLTAEKLNLKPEQVLVASTGVIGRRLPMEKISAGISKLYPSVVAQFIEPDKSGNYIQRNRYIKQTANSAAEAIMTTDTFPKIVNKKLRLPSLTPNRYPLTTASIWACAKGAGMIQPELISNKESGIGNRESEITNRHATFLCFILTDVAISQKKLNTALNNSVEKSFNCTTIDGDTSTNDTVLMLANGAAKNKKIVIADKNFDKFQNALDKICLELAQMVARDGEGAKKFVTINVTGTKDFWAARHIGKIVATSPLVKTAIFGNDPNWGRIMAAVGRAGVKFNPDKIDIYFNSLPVVKNGLGVRAGEKELHKLLQQKEIEIRIDLHQGKSSATVYTCDLSFDYVKINACYTT